MSPSHRPCRFAISAFGALLIVGLLGGCGGEKQAEPAAYLSVELEYSGSEACVGCHQAEYELWRGSHHDLAMQEAKPETVLGDFDDVNFEHYGVVSTFSRRGDEYWVRTDGPDGSLQDYRVDYAFGVEPLQQYLVEFPGGRYQVLPLCWDTRPAAQGGQRWFHIYPDEHLPAGDPLHWTGINQNWNYMCAECHSTDLRKGYDSASGSYETTWEEIDVACEACHGPGSRHLAWAEEMRSLQAHQDERTKRAERIPSSGSMGLAVRLKDLDEPAWSFDETGIARRSPARTSNDQVETCGRCHSRRSVIRDPYVHGRELLDSHRVSLLEPDLYHPDGQILEEVYVYGSFLQSRMHREGVTCSDCHDPHSLRLWNEGNALCAKCHLPAKYDSEEHHHHRAGQRGSECIACHMRAETYMVVDPRHDHSFRVPRPDLSLELGTPNACIDCHRETSPEWAAERFVEWYPERAASGHYGRAIQAGRQARPSAGPALASLVDDLSQPGIVRATAVGLLADRLDANNMASLSRAARDPDPLVRMAVAATLDSADPAAALEIGRPLLEDPVLAVRAAAANSLLDVPAQLASPDDAAILSAALEDLRRTQLVNADRPESHAVLGSLHARAGEVDEARAEYERALALDPGSTAVRVNLADLHRQAGNENEAERILREAIEIDPENADVHHALGLALARQKRIEEALAELELAASQAPDNLRFGYVYAVAAHSTGRIPLALRILESLYERWPSNAEVLVALVNYYAQMGGFAEAERFAVKLVEVSPGDPQAQALLSQIRSRR